MMIDINGGDNLEVEPVLSVELNAQQQRNIDVVMRVLRGLAWEMGPARTAHAARVIVLGLDSVAAQNQDIKPGS